MVPTDFSDNAFNALKYACQVFKYEKCEIFVMHAYADVVYQQDKLTKRSQLDVLKEEIKSCINEILIDRFVYIIKMVYGVYEGK